LNTTSFSHDRFYCRHRCHGGAEIDGAVNETSSNREEMSKGIGGPTGIINTGPTPGLFG